MNMGYSSWYKQGGLQTDQGDWFAAKMRAGVDATTSSRMAPGDG